MRFTNVLHMYLSLSLGQHVKELQENGDKYHSAGETWIRGRGIRSEQKRATGIYGTHIAYGKRLPKGGTKKLKGFFAYDQKPTAKERMRKVIRQHDKSVATAVNQV